MSFIGGNEFKCFSSSIQQSCIRYGLNVTEACAPMARGLVRTHGVRLNTIQHVILHQVPNRRGIIDYLMELFTVDGTVWCEHFKGSGLGALMADFVLYDRKRDGIVEHLHLQH